MALRKQRPDLLPDERRLEEPAEQNDRRPARSPLAVRRAVDRLAVPQLAYRDARIRRRGVVDHRRERQRDHEAEERVEDPADDPHVLSLWKRVVETGGAAGPSTSTFTRCPRDGGPPPHRGRRSSCLEQ